MFERKAVCTVYTGISNMIGRAGAGALATVPQLNILHLNNISLIVTGISTGLIPVLCTSYTTMLVYAVVFGLSVGTTLTCQFVISSYSSSGGGVGSSSRRSSSSTCSSNSSAFQCFDAIGCP